MKPFTHLLFICLTAVFTSAQDLDQSGYCLTLNPNAPSKIPCGRSGTLRAPSSTNLEYPAFSVLECATRCHDPNKTSSCLSFGFTPGASSDDAGSCVLYPVYLDQMKFRNSSASSVVYYNRRCFLVSPTNDDPLLDGNFKDFPGESGNPWSHGGSNGASAEYYGALTENANGEHSESEYIAQTMTTCIGKTYALQFPERTSDEHDGAVFEVELNRVPLIDGTVGNTAYTQVGPLYFTTTSTKTVLELALDSSQGNSAFVYIPDMSADAVYRGSLPSGTQVYTV